MTLGPNTHRNESKLPGPTQTDLSCEQGREETGSGDRGVGIVIYSQPSNKLGRRGIFPTENGRECSAQGVHPAQGALLGGGSHWRGVLNKEKEVHFPTENKVGPPRASALHRGRSSLTGGSVMCIYIKICVKLNDPRSSSQATRPL